MPGGHYDPGPLKPGDTEQAVIERMGKPTSRSASVQGGSRLTYVRGPMGQHTYMVDLDARQRMTGWFNALDPARLRQITPGMAEAEVQALLGPPAQVRQLAIEGRTLWAWRFPTYECEWFVATFSAQRSVLDAGTMTDPRCDVDRD